MKDDLPPEVVRRRRAERAIRAGLAAASDGVPFSQWISMSGYQCDERRVRAIAEKLTEEGLLDEV